jgi:hypothetical protein
MLALFTTSDFFCRAAYLSAFSRLGASMSDFKVGEHVTVILTGGRLVEAEIKAIVETKQGKRLEVSFVNQTARIYLWQVVEKLR